MCRAGAASSSIVSRSISNSVRLHGGRNGPVSVAFGTEQRAQTLLRPVNPYANGVYRAPESLGGLSMCELLPVHEQQRLAVGGLQFADRRQQALLRWIARPFRHLNRGALFVREAAKQVAPAAGAAIPPGDDPAGRPVKPESVTGGRRNVGQSPPRDQEDLGDDVGHVVRTAEPVHRVDLYRTEVRLVETTKAKFPLIMLLVTSRHGRSSHTRSPCLVDLRLRRGAFRPANRLSAQATSLRSRTWPPSGGLLVLSGEQDPRLR